MDVTTLQITLKMLFHWQPEVGSNTLKEIQKSGHFKILEFTYYIQSSTVYILGLYLTFLT